MIYTGHPDQQFGHVTYAQHGDDLMILNLLHLIHEDYAINIEFPLWLDIGAHHPETISNTTLLSLRNFWGVNVDASQAAIDAFNRERPLDVNVCIGVMPTMNYGKCRFHKYSETSGRNTFSEQEVESLKGLMTVREVVEVDTTTINALVTKYCGGLWPCLLSIDIEGCDFAVLESADFSVSKPAIICVETRRNGTQRMKGLLEEKGYFLYCRMGENLFFVATRYLDRVY
jgi:hypothetical protein